MIIYSSLHVHSLKQVPKDFIFRLNKNVKRVDSWNLKQAFLLKQLKTGAMTEQSPLTVNMFLYIFQIFPSKAFPETLLFSNGHY